MSVSDAAPGRAGGVVDGNNLLSSLSQFAHCVEKVLRSRKELRFRPCSSIAHDGNWSLESLRRADRSIQRAGRLRPRSTSSKLGDEKVIALTMMSVNA
jgi:hypothetical protein